MRRAWLIASSFALLATDVHAAGKKAPGLEYGMNRAGADYRDFALDSTDPADCLAACKADTSCRAFTWVKPGANGDKAHCWLKSSAPDATADDRCVSGLVARPAPKPGDLEMATNRPGGDYRDFATSAKAEDCRDACNADSACKAFTWVTAGVQGDQAHCWLKNAASPPQPDRNCVSGLGVHAASGGGCPCVATTCAQACKNAMVVLCKAGGTLSDDGSACQKCIDANCPAH